MNARDAIILTGKANRKQRKPRARSKESIIKKLKFQVSDGALGIASIYPSQTSSTPMKYGCTIQRLVK